MFRDWTKGNTLRILLLAVLYVAANILILNMGAIHPVMFVLYTCISAILLPGLYLAGASQVRGPGVAALYGGMMLLVVIAVDLSWYKVMELSVMILLAEFLRRLFGYESWNGLQWSAIVMCFSNFGYSMCIWLMRDFTYHEALAEMPEGYADTLMRVSPAWTFPTTLLLTVVLALISANICKRLLQLEYNGS